MIRRIMESTIKPFLSKPQKPKIEKLAKIEPIKSLLLTPERKETMGFLNSIYETVIGWIPIPLAFRFLLSKLQELVKSTENKLDDNALYGVHQTLHVNGIVDFPPTPLGSDSKIIIKPSEFPPWLEFIYNLLGEKLILILLKILEKIADLSETKIDDHAVYGIHVILYSAGLVSEMPEEPEKENEPVTHLPASVMKPEFAGKKIPITAIGL